MLLKVAQTPLDEAFMTTLGGLGLRCSELLLLKPDYFNFVTNEVSIPTLKRKGHPIHVISVDPRLMGKFGRFHLQDGVHVGYPPYPGKNYMKYYHRLRRLLKLAGLPTWYSTHAFRHMHGTVVWDVTGDYAQVKYRLRHTMPSDPCFLYMHASQDKQREVAKLIYEKIFEKNESEAPIVLLKNNNL